MKLKSFHGFVLLLALACAEARADAALLESTTPFLPETTLAELVGDIAAAGKNQGRNPDQPGRRLRLSCNHQPLPPGWVAGSGKAQFAWSCLVARERKTPLITAETWVVEVEDIFSGATEGDPAGAREALRLRLYQFFQLKPPASPSTKP